VWSMDRGGAERGTGQGKNGGALGGRRDLDRGDRANLLVPGSDRHGEYLNWYLQESLREFKGEIAEFVAKV